MANSSENNNANAFESFLQGWLVRQEHYLDELLTAQQNSNTCQDPYLQDLITRTLSHYEQYYTQKSLAARNDVLLFFSPTWLSTLERTLLWIAGFKPGLLCQIVSNTVDNLSEQQDQRLKTLVRETKARERSLNSRLTRIQESAGHPPMQELMRRVGRREVVAEETAVLRSYKAEMVAVLESADMLRTRTATKVLEILSPAQGVKFLAAATKLQLSIRELGLKKDADKKEHRRN